MGKGRRITLRPFFLLASIHRNAWKGYLPNFALTAFLEVRKASVLHAERYAYSQG
jgi:hypothetical protein